MKTALITNYWKNSDGGGMKIYLTNPLCATEDVQSIYSHDGTHMSGITTADDVSC